jgi:ATP-dependent DNA ligase
MAHSAPQPLALAPHAADHETGDDGLILKHAGKLGFEGLVSKTIDAPHAPGNRGLWRKAKCLNRQELVIVGWSDPEGSRPYFGHPPPLQPGLYNLRIANTNNYGN